MVTPRSGSRAPVGAWSASGAGVVLRPFVPYRGGISWADQDPAVWESIERFFRVGYRNSLLTEWVQAGEGLHARLEAGCRVIGVGIRRGATLILLAGAYPASQATGYGVQQPSAAV